MHDFCDPSINRAKMKEITALCKNRMDTSYYKYGKARDNFSSGRVDAVGSAERCIEIFRKTNNTEYLLDAINYLAFRFIFPLPNEKYRQTDSSESAGVCGTPVNMV